jgi:hypothetical protein
MVFMIPFGRGTIWRRTIPRKRERRRMGTRIEDPGTRSEV